MIQVYPELLDPNYYRSLKDKSADFGKEKFKYSLTKIPITTKDFHYLVNTINKSGYWKSSYEIECKNMPMDGCGIVFEANTPDKYNIVSSSLCPGDSSEYTKALQEIIIYAKMNKEFNLILDGKVDTASPQIKIRE